MDLRYGGNSVGFVTHVAHRHTCEALMLVAFRQPDSQCEDLREGEEGSGGESFDRKITK